jgi:uncharacterized membrane protein
MPYREKSAWLALIAMAAAYIPYFVITAQHPPAPAGAAIPQLALFARFVILQIIIMTAGHAYFALRSRTDARIPPDERDRAIERRSVNSAYYVLICGMVLVGCVMPFNSRGWDIVNAALLMIVLAETVHYGVVVASYRRQAS